MSDSFSSHARQALAYSEQAALELNHNFVDTEHLLLGLLRVPEGGAGRLLERLGVEREALRRALARYVVQAAWNRPIRELPRTLLAQKALAHAEAASRAMGRARVGTAWLLLGLLSVEEGLAAQVLFRQGLTEDQVRAALEERAPGEAP